MSKEIIKKGVGRPSKSSKDFKEPPKIEFSSGLNVGLLDQPLPPKWRVLDPLDSENNQKIIRIAKEFYFNGDGYGKVSEETGIPQNVWSKCLKQWKRERDRYDEERFAYYRDKAIGERAQALINFGINIITRHLEKIDRENECVDIKDLAVIAKILDTMGSNKRLEEGKPTEITELVSSKREEKVITVEDLAEFEDALPSSFLDEPRGEDG